MIEFMQIHTFREYILRFFSVLETRGLRLGFSVRIRFA
jgi:hypothetical protein